MDKDTLKSIDFQISKGKSSLHQSINSKDFPACLLVPIDLIIYCIYKGLQPELKVLIAAKIVTPGIFTKFSYQYHFLCKYVGNQPRTVNKHLDHLVRMGWMGYNSSTQNYFVRSWEHLRFKENEFFIHRTSVQFRYGDMANFAAFIAGSIVNAQLLKYQYYWKKRIRNKKLFDLKVAEQQKGQLILPVVNKSSTTLQGRSVAENPFFRFPEYFGLSNNRIAQLLKCSYTHACNLKHAAERAGYIHTKPKLRQVRVLVERNSSIRSLYYKGSEEYARRLRFITEGVGSEKKILLVQQLHDEIIPKMVFKRINYWRNYLTKQRRRCKPAPFISFQASDSSHVSIRRAGTHPLPAFTPIEQKGGFIMH